MGNFHVGQELWWVSRWVHGEKVVTVEKVGRKWLMLSNGHRVDKETLDGDGGRFPSPGRCYLTQEDCETKKALANAWADVRRQITGAYRAPDGITIEQIREAASLLGLGEIA